MNAYSQIKFQKIDCLKIECGWIPKLLNWFSTNNITSYSIAMMCNYCQSLNYMSWASLPWFLIDGRLWINQRFSLCNFVNVLNLCSVSFPSASVCMYKVLYSTAKYFTTESQYFVFMYLFVLCRRFLFLHRCTRIIV